MAIDKQRLCSAWPASSYVRVAISSLAQSQASCANVAVDALSQSFLRIAASSLELRLMVVSMCVECSWGVSYMHDMCAAHFVDRPQEIGNNHIPVMRHRTKFLRYHLSDCRHLQNPLPFQLLSPALRQRAASCARDSSTRVSRL